MHLQHLTAALIHLSMAFDPKETPQGAAFWLDVRRRLNDYRTKAINPAHNSGDHTCPDTLPPNIPFPPVPSLNYDYAKCAGNSIDNAFTWEATNEGQNYWTRVVAILRDHAPFNPSARLDGQEGKYVGHFDERILLKKMGFERPDFAEELFYRPGQWPHHDPENRALVRYIPLGKPAFSKHFVSAKPGKFLAAHYGEALTEPLIADFAAKFRTAAEPPALLLARTADEIAHVYATGPSSCMSGGKKVDGIESVRAYASPDLAIAYAKRGDAITARALVCPERKIHSRIYGDSTSFEVILNRAGYKNIYNSGLNQDFKAFDGLRVAPLLAKGWRPAHRLLEEAGEPILIAPYFDLNNGYGWWDGEWLRIGAPPTGKTKHTLKGGYTIAAIPAEGPIPTYPDPGHFSATIGHNGVNVCIPISYRDAGREPARTTAEASKEALAQKQARAQAAARAQANQATLGQILAGHLERDRVAAAQLAAYQNQYLGRLA